MKILIFIALLAAQSATTEQSFKFMFIPRCKGKGECGAGLLQKQWKKLGECNDGHQWEYVLEKDKKQVVCSGMNVRGGPEETPCKPFKGALQEFAKCGRSQNTQSR